MSEIYSIVIGPSRLKRSSETIKLRDVLASVDIVAALTDRRAAELAVAQMTSTETSRRLEREGRSELASLLAEATIEVRATDLTVVETSSEAERVVSVERAIRLVGGFGK